MASNKAKTGKKQARPAGKRAVNKTHKGITARAAGSCRQLRSSDPIWLAERLLRELAANGKA
jgi:hypothetical protein